MLFVGNFCDVTERNLAEICKVSLLGGSIPFGAEHASATSALKGETKSANSSEEINERKTTCLGRLKWRSALNICHANQRQLFG
jgi:hypothetical protein